MVTHIPTVTPAIHQSAVLVGVGIVPAPSVVTGNLEALAIVIAENGDDEISRRSGCELAAQVPDAQLAFELATWVWHGKQCVPVAPTRSPFFKPATK
jgi:hypothetical protein